MKCRLGDICTITKGGTGIMKAIPGSYTMVTLGEEDKTHIDYQFDAKAVIIPLVSSTGHGHASMKRVKYCEGKFALGNILCAVIPNDENFVLAKYLHIYLHWNREELLVSQMKGMANVSLPMNRIEDVIVAVPSIEKQIEIIELEKQLVEKEIETSILFADQLTLLENLNQAILQDAVQGKLVPQDPNDEPAAELIERIKDEKAKSGKKEKSLLPIKPEEIPFDIPRNWVWCRLGELIEYTENLDIQKYLSPDTIINYVDIDAIDNLNFVIREAKQKTVSELSTRARRILKPNYIVYSTVRPYLKNIAIVEDEKDNYIGSTGFNVFKTLDVELKYAFYYLLTPYVNNSFKDLMVGFNSPSITNDQFKKNLFPLPPLTEQKRIVAEIEKQFAKTKQLKEHIIASQEASAQLLKALLHEAFEGKKAKVKQKAKVIELKPTNVDYYRRTVLAAEIVWQLHKEPTLGHLKLQKLIYLCQKSADMQLPTNFLRQAMGPYDNRLMRSIDKQLKEKKWFEYKKEEILKYQPLEKAGQHHTDFLKYFSVESESIQYIINKFKPTKSDTVEIVATLYACMDNMLSENTIFSEALLFQRFYEWSEEKKKFGEGQIKKVFTRMKETGIIPNGYNL
ncbi:MAG: restriction endonuclease subunit S [Bacteroidia bacterium]|nr:restriction endonuclease subunit S [Bacteroidia bacterium]